MLRFFRSIERFFAANILVGSLTLFVLSATIFTYIQFEPSFRDPDSFYHVKMAMLLAQQGIIRDFHWLPFTTLATAYADHHFLYHAALIPFIAAFGPFAGMVAATVTFAAGAIVAFYLMLRSWRIRFAWWFAASLLLSGGFLFRLNLAKATAVSLIILFAALALMARKKIWPLFFLAWMYVWAYGGWPILFGIGAIALVAKIIADHFSEEMHTVHSWARPWFWRRLVAGSAHAWRDFSASIEVRQVAAITAGLAVGLVVNPYFPANLSFYWQQIVAIAVVNAHGSVGVGAEWYPLAFPQLLGEAGIAFVLFAIAIAAMIVLVVREVRIRGRYDAQVLKQAAFTFVLAAVFFALTLRSHRNVEYFVPFAIAFDALFISSLLRLASLAEFRDDIVRAIGRTPARAAAVALITAFIIFGGQSVSGTKLLYRDGVPWTTFGGGAAWLRAHTEPGSVVFHSDWDDFPMLFFYDDANRYVVGLDPRFFSDYDPQKYRQWVALTTGTRRTGVAELIGKGFGARYVFVENDHTAMQQEIEQSGGFSLAYSDNEVRIYQRQ